jgi:hypothetical protein
MKHEDINDPLNRWLAGLVVPYEDEVLTEIQVNAIDTLQWLLECHAEGAASGPERWVNNNYPKEQKQEILHWVATFTKDLERLVRSVHRSVRKEREGVSLTKGADV